MADKKKCGTIGAGFSVGVLLAAAIGLIIYLALNQDDNGTREPLGSMSDER